MPRTPVLLAVLFNALLLCACNRHPGVAVTPNPHTDAPGIAWFKGDVADAFAAAEKDNKPVLLYWGAIWCPPCQQLKSTVFSRQDFIEKSRLFLPVYLDGDDPSAQKWGEEFRVQGYPTLVVLDSQHRELMRIAGSMDLSQYAAVLDTALADLQPIDSLLKQTGAAETLAPAACRRLAFNAWTLEELSEKEFSERAHQLANASRLCETSPLEHARLAVFAAYFQSAAEAGPIGQGGKPSDDLLGAISQVQDVLNGFGADAKFADALQSLNEDFFNAAKAAGESISAPLLSSYVMAMDEEAADPNLAEADQLAALRSKLVAARVLSADGKIPEALSADVRARISSALAKQHIPYVRSGILNSTLNVYDELGLYQEGYDLIKTELPRVQSPFYFKADLAELAEKIGLNEEALDWWNQAYRESQGAATRFQWGQNYASALMRLKPRDAARIREVTEQVLAELDGPDRIYRRARLRLEKLDKDLRAWNEAARGAHNGVLNSLHAGMQRVCTRIPASEPARGSCDRFLTPT